MKKSYNGCRAYSTTDDYALGYKTKIIYIPISALDNRILEKMIPLEQCPKPRTYDEYFLQKKLLKEKIKAE